MSRGLGDVYKRQPESYSKSFNFPVLLYTSGITTVTGTLLIHYSVRYTRNKSWKGIPVNMKSSLVLLR